MMRRSLLGALACLVVLTACVPPGPDAPGRLPAIERSLAVLTGTVGHVAVDLPFRWVTSTETEIAGDLTAAVQAGGVGDTVTLNAAVTAPVAAEPGPAAVVIEIEGCLETADPCPVAKRQPVTVRIAVSVEPPGSHDSFETIPPTDPARLVEQADGSAVVPDELSVLFHRGAGAAVAIEAIEAAGGQVVGGRDALGLYRARFAVGSLGDAQAHLEALESVETVFPAAWLPLEADALPPGDWDDDQNDDAATWTFDATGAPSAWENATGGSTIEVGLVDWGIWPIHTDLVDEIYRDAVGVGRYQWFGERPVARDYAADEGHGTHVAGTMCASANGVGLVGVMWSCSLNALDLIHATVLVDELAVQIDYWLRDPELRGGDGITPDRPLRVLNMSFGYGPNPNSSCDNSHPGQKYEKAWRALVEANPQTLFVVTAGNCPNKSANDALPRSIAKDYENMVSVSATGYHRFGEDAPLASYSGPDGEVAAPGGDSDHPVWSTMYNPVDCDPVRPGCRLQAIWSDRTHPLANSLPMAGTSMAAPFVSGTAGLMLAVNPSMSARQLAACLTGTANATTVTTQPSERPPAWGLREIRVDLAVECARGAAAVEPAFFHTCALQLTGRVACWGGNEHGQLGDATTADHKSPVIVDGIDDAVQVTTGFFQSCALRSDGTVWCWGGNGYGALGDGTYENRTTPVRTMWLSDVVQIDAGESSTCALDTSAVVWCWGDGSSGQLGGGEGYSSPVPLMTLFIPSPTRVSVGDDFACAVTELGEVWCWGAGDSGQLGDGQTDDRPVPAPVPGLGFAVDVSAGRGHACATLADGTVQCWGNNMSGQLGNGTTDDVTSPIIVPGLDTVVRVSAGDDHTCARLLDGTARCWGANWSGQIGDGLGSVEEGTAHDNRLTPSPVAGLSGVVDVKAGWAHSCAVLDSGVTKCWGNSNWGQLGDSTLQTRWTPVTAGA